MKMLSATLRALAALLLPVLAAAFVPSYLQPDLGLMRTASDVVYEVPFPGWPGGVVPYVVSDRFRPTDVQLIHEYMDYIMDNSCVQFVERTNQTAYLDIITSMDEAGTEFFSFMYTGERSVMIIPPPALPLRGPSVLLLTLGLAPEHTRGDRDEHIYFNCSQCQDNFKMMMQKRYKLSVDLKYPYDGKSMTHIGTDEVKKINAVMWALDPNKTTFNAKQESLSETDLKKLDFFYNCSVPVDGTGDGAAGTGDSSSSGTGGGTTSENGSATGTGGEATGTDGGATDTDGGATDTDGGATGTSGGNDSSSTGVVSLGAKDGSSGTGGGTPGEEGDSLGTGGSSMGTDGGSLGTDGMSSGTGGANDNSSTQTTAGSGTTEGISGTGVNVSSESVFSGVGSGLEPGTDDASSADGSENLIGGSASSSQVAVDPASVGGGSGLAWNGATFVNTNTSASAVAPPGDPPMNYSMMIISPLNGADEAVTSSALTVVSSFLLWISYFILK